VPAEITGGDEFRRSMVAMRARAVRAAGAALYQEGQALRTESLRIVPVDLGALRSSAIVSNPEATGSVVTVTVGYGGPSAPYAIFVHEIPPPPGRSPSGRSARHNPPTQWKYLEQPARERAGGMQGRLAARMRTELERPA